MTLNKELLKEKERLEKRIRAINELLEPVIEVRKSLSFEYLLNRVSIVTGVHPDWILSQSRKDEYKFARQLLQYCIKRFMDLPLTEIAEKTNLITHGTILNSIKKIENIMQLGKPVRKYAYIERIVNELTD